jgi:tRNA threonylcarbamoyladenosine biosynthesis protein TsaB
MSYILNIHTATETAIINLTKDEEVLGTFINYDTRQHAALLHTAIRELFQTNNVDIKKLNAVGVSSGPGSYTGIRVGLATAKGLCYALDIPLITFNTLELMAFSSANFAKDDNALYCPMIDARRMEVFTAVYNYTLQELIPPSAMILDENSFADILNLNKVYFSGSGNNKFKSIAKSVNAFFINDRISTESLTAISWKKFRRNDFENIPYAQPLYIKDFYTILKNRNHP